MWFFQQRHSGICFFPCIWTFWMHRCKMSHQSQWLCVNLPQNSRNHHVGTLFKPISKHNHQPKLKLNSNFLVLNDPKYRTARFTGICPETWNKRVLNMELHLEWNLSDLWKQSPLSWSFCFEGYWGGGYLNFPRDKATVMCNSYAFREVANVCGSSAKVVALRQLAK